MITNTITKQWPELQDPGCNKLKSSFEGLAAAHMLDLLTSYNRLANKFLLSHSIVRLIWKVIEDLQLEPLELNRVPELAKLINLLFGLQIPLKNPIL